MSGIDPKPVLEWMETLEVQEGALQGQRLKLMPFQRKFLRKFLSPEVRIALLTMARGNAKTSTAAALAACALDGPLSLKNGEILLTASSLKQAGKAFKHVKWFLEARVGQPLKKHPDWRYIDNSHEKYIENLRTGITLIGLGSDPDRAHSYAPFLVLADEPAKWPRTEGTEMFIALSTSLGKVPNSKALFFGTRPEDDLDHFVNDLLVGGPGIYAQDHSVDLKVDDEFSLDTIRKANPAWDFFPDLREIGIMQREQARDGGRALHLYRALRLNAGTREVDDNELLVSPENWGASVVSVLPPRGGPVCVGLDLGTSSSMTAAALYWPDTGRLETLGAFPAEPSLATRGKDDGVGDRYINMEERKEIRVYPGQVTPVAPFLRLIAEIVAGENVLSLTTDRHRKPELQQAVAEASITWELDWRGVGAGSDGMADIYGFQAEVLESRVKHLPSLAMESALRDCIIKRHPRTGYPYLDKPRQRGRIDMATAAVHAVGRGRRYRNPDKKVVQRRASDYLVPSVAMQKDPERPFPITRPLVRK